jgi:putative oxidoreductase
LPFRPFGAFLRIPQLNMLQKEDFASLRRLYSTFASGWPGAGLLLMRLVAGASLIAHGLARLQTGPQTQLIAPSIFAMAVGIFLLAGLWTPISGSLAAVLGIWSTISRPGDPWAYIFFATIGAALALLGPGAWSVDARLFGWKRIDVDRESRF